MIAKYKRHLEPQRDKTIKESLNVTLQLKYQDYRTKKNIKSSKGICQFT
jgi:hypothetical protein